MNRGKIAPRSGCYWKWWGSHGDSVCKFGTRRCEWSLMSNNSYLSLSTGNCSKCIWRATDSCGRCKPVIVCTGFLMQLWVKCDVKWGYARVLFWTFETHQWDFEILGDSRWNDDRWESQRGPHILIGQVLLRNHLPGGLYDKRKKIYCIL